VAVQLLVSPLLARYVGIGDQITFPFQPAVLKRAPEQMQRDIA